MTGKDYDEYLDLEEFFYRKKLISQQKQISELERKLGDKHKITTKEDNSDLIEFFGKGAVLLFFLLVFIGFFYSLTFLF